MDEAMKQHGAFSWNELMTTDVTGAKKFYAEAFGWEFRDEPMEGMTYTIVNPADILAVGDHPANTGRTGNAASDSQVMVPGTDPLYRCRND